MPTSRIADPSYIDTTLDSRSISFENPSGARGSGGTTAGGRKGAAAQILAPGDTVTLADIAGPGTIRHIWMTIAPAPPEELRAVVIEVYYDDLTEPSLSTPLPDFFGCPHGRLVDYFSALHAIQEGRGLNSYIPMPFNDRIGVSIRNASPSPVRLFQQIDYTLEPQAAPKASFLHASFRRENPTTLGEDFTIADGLDGPGRFLGAVIGVRVNDDGHWYGEGEVKIYRDGDRDFPTICGTGLEDYAGSAWGVGAHAALYGGAPLVIPPPADPASAHSLAELWRNTSEFVGFYRWHLLDPVMFGRELRVTIQQIGGAYFGDGQENEYEHFVQTHRPAGGDFSLLFRRALRGRRQLRTSGRLLRHRVRVTA